MCMCSHRRGGTSGSRTRVPSLLHEQPSLYQRGHFPCVLLSHLIFSQRCLKGIHLRALWTKNLPEGYRMRSAKKLMTPATAFQNSQGTARKIYHFPEWNYIFPYSQKAWLIFQGLGSSGVRFQTLFPTKTHSDLNHSRKLKGTVLGYIRSDFCKKKVLEVIVRNGSTRPTLSILFYIISEISNLITAFRISKRLRFVKQNKCHFDEILEEFQVEPNSKMFNTTFAEKLQHRRGSFEINLCNLIKYQGFHCFLAHWE